MLMALKYRGYSIRYRHSSLKVDNRRRSTVSRQDNRLSSKHIFRRHYFLQSFQRKILCYLISTDRIGTFAPCANPVAGKAQVKSVIKVVLGSSRQWRTTILQVVLAVM
ncbi:hypothetical protein G6S66_004074 [Salmonella enterica]|nr:hypothetical protein [Salmonella enterica]